VDLLHDSFTIWNHIVKISTILYLWSHQWVVLWNKKKIVDVRVMLWIYNTTHWWLHIYTHTHTHTQYCGYVDNIAYVLWNHVVNPQHENVVSFIGLFAKETYNFKEPTKNSHPIYVLWNHVVNPQHDSFTIWASTIW